MCRTTHNGPVSRDPSVPTAGWLTAADGGGSTGPGPTPSEPMSS
jgi:hypothetical protein